LAEDKEKEMKNHEGYHDPTACKAVRRAYRQRKHKGHELHLFYSMSEARGFQEAQRAIQGYI